MDQVDLGYKSDYTSNLFPVLKSQWKSNQLHFLTAFLYLHLNMAQTCLRGNFFLLSAHDIAFTLTPLHEWDRLKTVLDLTRAKIVLLKLYFTPYYDTL